MFVSGVSVAFLRQIKIQGFKSFGNRPVTLNLEKGFTAIVGENGCGKSNILDAVCFVLGRLSSKSLRAENFASLLFNGGDGKPPAKVCRVTLVFDNADRHFPVDLDEVVLSREVDTTGVSAYRIAGSRCTRTELLDTISVAGLHPEGHNIVMQNELASVITMSTAEIRQIVEGVAGISVFDEKKRQIEFELDKVDQNLQVVQLRTDEIRQEYERLKRDRVDALRWQEITHRLNQLERDLVFGELSRIEQRLEGLKAEHDIFTAQISEYENQRRADKERKASLEQTVQEDSVRNKQFDRQLHSKELEETRLREQLKGLQLTIENVDRQIESLSTSLDHLQEQHAEGKTRQMQLDEEIKQLRARETELKDQITPLRERLSSLSEEVSKPETEYLELRSQIIQLTESIEQKRSELGETAALLRVKSQKIQELDQQIKESLSLLPEQELELREAQTHFELIKKELETNQETLKQLEAQQQTIQNSIIEQKQQQTNLDQLVQTTKEELLEAQTRVKTIREFKKYGLSRKAAIESVLKFVKDNKVPGVYGTLGSLAKTSTDHAIALEVAGGNRLDFIVVDTEETATKCIDYLKSSQAGRATFIPLSSIKAKSLRFKESSKGVVGNAIDLLTFDEKYRLAFEFVFGRTLIVKDLEVARNLDAPGLRKITIEGDVVDPNRTFTGGFYKRLSSIALEEETRIPELQKKLKELRELQATAETEYLKGQQAQDEIEQQIRETESRISSFVRRVENAEASMSEKEEALIIFKTSLEELQKELEDERAFKTQLDENDAAEKSRIVELSSERETLQKQLSDIERAGLDPSMNQLRNQLDEFETLLQEIQLQLTDKLGELRHLQGEQERVGRDIKQTANELKRAKANNRRNQKETDTIKVKLTEIEKALEQIKSEIQRLEAQIVSNEAEQRQLTIRIEELFNEISDVKMKQSKQEARIESWEDRYQAQKEKTEGMEPPVAAVDPSSVYSLRRQKAELEQEREKLGLINQKAVERFDEVQHDYEEILEKESRIREDREAILDAMHRAEEEKYKVFMTAFSSISQNFSDIYEQLTNGEGHLELENPENPFLGGIRMKVRPAGKRIQYLDALSGGEKALTALTFMFALQLHQPAPFYFLDEIDEALDPNNADRVARLIQNLAQDSQIIIISHNEITIRFAQTLLGCAMVDGLSKVFSVKFEEGLLLVDGKRAGTPISD
jgi:chromosome segregation protein